MGVYRAAIVTESGQNLIAQALANETPLIFTSAKTSSYSYPVGTNVPALTGLQDVVQSVMPFDSKVLGGNVAQVSVRFDNDGVDQTYRIETIGLYAKIEGGTETLFSVTQATTPDEMPVQSDVSPSAYIYNIQHTVQNASQITLTVNPAGTATVQDIMDIETPEFDDSGTVEGISSFPSFLETMKSKMNFFQFFRNLKAGLQFILHAGQIVNNCVTDNAGLPLSAAQGKVLKDLYTQLYSDKVSKSDIEKNGVQIGSSLKVYSYSAGDKTITAIIKAKEKLCHMTGILIVDQNQVMDIYSTGVGSGITVISKTSVVDTPTLTNEKSINIPLVPWSSFIFLCIDSYDISES
nr:MAG TPA: tail collar fiber protein [Bacteriophage sp.]